VICLILLAIVLVAFATGSPSGGPLATILVLCMVLLCPLLMWFGMRGGRGPD